MSWSVSATGKTEEVKAIIARQFENSGPCVEPEEGIRQASRATIALALGGITNPKVTAVTVSAYGSQGQSTDAEGDTVFTNSLKIEVGVQL